MCVSGPVLDSNPGQLTGSIVWNIELGRKISDADIAEALILSNALYQRTAQFFEKYDALLLPTAQVLPIDASQEYPASINGQDLPSYLEWMPSCCDIAVTGAPALSIPAGFSASGLPIGMQIVAAPRAEATLLAIGRIFEQATGFAMRRP